MSTTLRHSQHPLSNYNKSEKKQQRITPWHYWEIPSMRVGQTVEVNAPTTMRLLELRRRSHNWRRNYTQVWSHRGTAHLKTRHPENHPSGPLRGGQMPYSEPVPLCIGQESQMTSPYLSASVKLARNTRRELKRNHYYNQSHHVDHGKDWALTYLNTEANIICCYLTIIASSPSLGS